MEIARLYLVKLLQDGVTCMVKAADIYLHQSEDMILILDYHILAGIEWTAPEQRSGFRPDFPENLRRIRFHVQCAVNTCSKHFENFTSWFDRVQGQNALSSGRRLFGCDFPIRAHASGTA